MIFRPWKRSAFANYFPITSLALPGKAPLVTRRGKNRLGWFTVVWRLNKLPAADFNRNSDYAEVTGTRALTIISRTPTPRSVCSHNRFFDSLEKFLSHAALFFPLGILHFFRLHDRLFTADNKYYFLLLGKNITMKLFLQREFLSFFFLLSPTRG